MPPGFVRQRYPALPFNIMVSLWNEGLLEQPCLQQDLDRLLNKVPATHRVFFAKGRSFLLRPRCTERTRVPAVVRAFISKVLKGFDGKASAPPSGPSAKTSCSVWAVRRMKYAGFRPSFRETRGQTCRHHPVADSELYFDGLAKSRRRLAAISFGRRIAPSLPRLYKQMPLRTSVTDNQNRTGFLRILRHGFGGKICGHTFIMTGRS
jgi:hypothetical protein